MIPPLDHRGFLPPGVHDCELDEASTWCGDDVRRRTIWDGLEAVLPHLRETFNQRNLAPPPLVLGGSYYSDKPSPADIEVTVVLPADWPGEAIAAYVMLYINHHEAWKTAHNVDFYPTLPGADQNDFRSFFQYVGEKSAIAKGLSPRDLRGVIQVMIW